ncbi:hypothetical protein Aeqsu_1708 [Aequorivita sublithincola DSM 14238]|uniref:Uncharacterized protein n=1 Tax=Aequorivita sublithincola (strain DSM 14238 / LMG 21431 / ACAM 643 / 9-3) TaxID=746697 RepID=I3YW21_AEQSU|nr:hypothetical protein [Aequorivita sublithincola]AFL81189.1 hypothetical protein Aeqsu_1708 [Aequorivita sublithincola DSM 14238]
MKIVEKDASILKYLKKRNIVKLYIKAKLYLEADLTENANLKLLKPKSSLIFSFRITKEHRALAVKENDVLIVFEISDYQ